MAAVLHRFWTKTAGWWLGNEEVARDGSWADVDWGTHSKRMPTQSLVKPREVRVPGLEPWDGALTAWLIQPDGESGVVVDVPKL